MAKFEKHADGLSAAERASQNKAANKRNAHGGDGKKITAIELSHNQGEDHDVRARKRGATNVPKKRQPFSGGLL